MNASSSLNTRQKLPDLVCLSHLRWNFVFQRPQHLMTRFARERRVFFIEEPVWQSGAPELKLECSPEGVWVATPHLPPPTGDAHPDEAVTHALLRKLLDTLFSSREIKRYILWYYTPMAIPFTRHLRPATTVYDCMDELSQFKNAPPALLRREAELFDRADIVFTGGYSLYEAKRDKHPNVHPFPSSVDAQHFAQARMPCQELPDQISIPRPRMGFFGVIDERMNLDLVRKVALARPHWQLILVGPTVKISPDALPRLPNLHYLGPKPYLELPRYLSGWDVALMPFALNDATRFISPTKTPEYLAAGKPVVSTSIRDVVRPYGELGLVRVADDESGFIQAIEESLGTAKDSWLGRVDSLLSTTSWDSTWARMRAEMNVVKARRPRSHGATERTAAAVKA